MKYQRQDLAYFPYQVEYAVNNYQPHAYGTNDFSNIIIGGLGGSGIAGRIVKQFFYDKAKLPIEVVSNYTLPAYADDKSLVILSSYSGNTEETLALADDALSRGSTVMTLTTGGTLAEKARANNWPVLYAEPGFQPRMALGYSLTYLLLILGDLFEYTLEPTMRTISYDFRDTENFIAKAENYFKLVKSHVNLKFIAVTDYLTQPIGLRFCQQMQENAKTEAFVHEIPEANHNVIESYYGDINSVFVFINSHSHERTKLRFDFLKELLQKNENLVVDIPLKNTSIEEMLKTIYILDWLALLVADTKQINSLEIPNIKTLKQVLAKSSAKQSH